MGSCCTFSLTSRAASSVPPVVAPCRSMRPKAAPQMMPPYTQASTGSSGCELTAMAYSELTSTFLPSSFRPRMNSGTFITSVITPTGSRGKKTFSTWATPVSPPMDI